MGTLKKTSSEIEASLCRVEKQFKDPSIITQIRILTLHGLLDFLNALNMNVFIASEATKCLDVDLTENFIEGCELQI